ncbi:MAG: MBL fold metallo-hydrolase [Bacillota bacterium]|nr:MBL fold metallo-hydrolase [Bacillota bacterium]
MTRVHFLGTSAAEGFPAPFCPCPPCTRARADGLRAARSRQSLLINDDLIVDFGPDTYAQQIWRGLNLLPVRYILQTHAHRDHYCPDEIRNVLHPKAILPPGHRRQLYLYGNAAVINQGKAVDGIPASQATANDRLLLHLLAPGDTTNIGSYRVTSLPARHTQSETALLHIIENRGNAILVGYDSQIFDDAIWTGLENWGGRLDLVLLDCTMVDGLDHWPEGLERVVFKGHMSIDDNTAIRDELLARGLADHKTQFISTHFAHMFDPHPDRIGPLFTARGLIAAYDGLVIDLPAKD